MIVEIPGVGRVEFPDSMSEAEMAAAAQRLHAEANQPPPPDETMLQGFNRGLAGFLDLPSKAVTVPARAMGANVTTTPFTDLFRMTGAIPEAATPTMPSRVGAAIGGSVVPTGGLFTQAARTAPAAAVPLLQTIQRAPASVAGAELAAATASGVGEQLGEEMAGPTGAAVGGLLGAAAPGAAAAATRGLFRGRSTPTMQRNVQDFAQAGVTPTAGQAGGASAVGGRQVEKVLSQLPGGNVVAEAAGERAANQFSARLQALSPEAESADVAGMVLKQGVEDFTADFHRRSSDLYDDFYNRLQSAVTARATRAAPGTVPQADVQLDNTFRAMDDILATPAGATETLKVLSNPKVRRLAKALGDDAQPLFGLNPPGMPASAVPRTMPWDAVRKVRSTIGRMIANPGLHADEPIGELKQLYAALSEDLGETARRYGGDVEDAFNRANNYFRQGVEHIQDRLEPLTKSNIPERIYRAFDRGAREGRTVLSWYKDALDDDQWAVVRDSLVRRMGRAPAGAQDATGEVFSIERFLTDWNRLDPDAKDLLFGDATLRGNLDQLARIAENVKRSARTLYNPSGTSANWWNTAALVGLGTSVGTGNWGVAAATALPMVGASGGMKLLTSPQFTSWLLDSTRVPAGAMTGQLARLSTLAEETNDEELAEALEAYLDIVQNAAQQAIEPMLPAQAGAPPPLTAPAGAPPPLVQPQTGSPGVPLLR